MFRSDFDPEIFIALLKFDFSYKFYQKYLLKVHIHYFQTELLNLFFLDLICFSKMPLKRIHSWKLDLNSFDIDINEKIRPSNSFLLFFPSMDYHSFSSFSKLSDLEEDLALYEEQSSQILWRHFKKTHDKITLIYHCKDKQKFHCLFSLIYTIQVDESGVEWAQIHEKINPFHSHNSSKKCSEIDFESMRRCFKVLEPQISRILLGNNLAVPIEIMEDLILGNHLTDAMKNLRNKYPKKFKKSLDNQTNKIKRKIKKMVLNGSERTIKKSKSFLSFISEQMEKTLNLFINEEFLGKEVDNKFDDETKIIRTMEEEEIEEVFKPMILF